MAMDGTICRSCSVRATRHALVEVVHDSLFVYPDMYHLQRESFTQIALRALAAIVDAERVNCDILDTWASGDVVRARGIPIAAVLR